MAYRTLSGRRRIVADADTKAGLIATGLSRYKAEIESLDDRQLMTAPLGRRVAGTLQVSMKSTPNGHSEVEGNVFIPCKDPEQTRRSEAFVEIFPEKDHAVIKNAGGAVYRARIALPDMEGVGVDAKENRDFGVLVTTAELVGNAWETAVANKAVTAVATLNQRLDRPAANTEVQESSDTSPAQVYRMAISLVRESPELAERMSNIAPFYTADGHLGFGGDSVLGMARELTGTK